MKNMKTLLLLSTSLLFVSCIKETKTVSKETNNSGVAECVYTNSCIGGTTGGSSTGGTTTGTTTSSTGGGSTDSSNWGKLYPNGVPTGTCSTPTGTGYDTRKANLTSSGLYDYYIPSNSITQNYINTDDSLKTEPAAIDLFSSDAIVKVRFKVLPEPPSAGTAQTLCYGRQTGSPGLGYTKMIMWVSIIGVKLDGTKVSHTVHPSGIEMSVNNCTPALDLSPYKAMYPGGVYLQINQVKVNDGGDTAWSSYGIPKTKCWAMQFEIATDTTKTFN
jgi:hypothetical protein